MSLQALPLPEAYRIQRANRHSFWTTHNAQPGNSAAERLSAGKFFIPQLKPEFKISENDIIFTMGSCFARNIEILLEKYGFTISSYSRELEWHQAKVTGDRGAAYNFLNRFNAFSIANEMRWALDPDSEYEENSLVPLNDGTYIDPHAHFKFINVGKEETLARRQELIQINRRVKESRIVIFTLGLSEVWKDNKTGLFMNFSPTKEMSDSCPERFSFHVTSYEENMQAMREVYDLLEKYGHPDFQMVVTVSPVSLAASFRDQDVVLSNCYSKSVLRCVADSISQLPRAHYFPSYEIITCSPYQHVWREDRRHPSHEVVHHITKLFLATYLEDPSKKNFFDIPFPCSDETKFLGRMYKQKHTRYACYGAGNFCHAMLLNLREESLPLPSYILDDNPKFERMQGIPVINPEKLDLTSVDEIVISTDTVEAKLKQRAKELFQDNISCICLTDLKSKA